MNNWLL